MNYLLEGMGSSFGYEVWEVLGFWGMDLFALLGRNQNKMLQDQCSRTSIEQGVQVRVL